MTNAQAIYGRNAARSLAPRDVEAAAFVFVNRMLAEATTGPDRIKALNRNHRLWSLLLNDVGLSSNGLPPILKKDLVSIGVWSMSYSITAMNQDRPVQPLIDINNDMIDALRPMPAASAAISPAKPAPYVAVAV